MSDLAATNCGGGCGVFNNDGNDCACNLIWIIVLLMLFCNNGTSLFGGNGDCGCGGSNNSCLWILLLLFFCGGNNGGGCGCGC